MAAPKFFSDIVNFGPMDHDTANRKMLYCKILAVFSTFATFAIFLFINMSVVLDLFLMAIPLLGMFYKNQKWAYIAFVVYFTLSKLLTLPNASGFEAVIGVVFLVVFFEGARARVKYWGQENVTA